MVASAQALAALFGGLGLLAATACPAAEISTLTVERAAGRYSVNLAVALDTTPQRAFNVMRDYPRLGDINPAIESVTLLDGATGGGQRVETAVKVCVLFFCRVLEQVQDMHATQNKAAGGQLVAVVLPELSNLRFGTAQWLITPCADGASACLDFSATIEPDFWVPPVIGPWAIKKKLREEAVQTSLGIESVARERP